MLGVQGIALASVLTQLSVITTLGFLLRRRLQRNRQGIPSEAAGVAALDEGDAF
jgi:hypothetical protein